MNIKEKIKSQLKTTNWKKSFKEYLIITLGAFILIIAIDVFFVPSNIAPGGGVTASAIMISHFTGLPVGLMMLLLNIPLLIIGFFYLGRFSFLIRTFYTVFIYNLGIDFFAHILPAGITDDLLLNALFGGILGGIGTGLIFRGRSTTAGLAIVTRVVQLKTGLPISQAYILTDGVILLIFGQVFGWAQALYSFLALYIFGLATDYILEGPSVIRTVFIVTNSPDAVTEGIFAQLSVGVTSWEARGMFTKDNHTVLFCTVVRSDTNALKNIVGEIDEDAFIVIGQGHQASGGVLKKSDQNI